MRWISSCLIVAALLLSGCLQKTPVASIKDAENIRRTTDGRVFVTGGDGLFEIRRNESGSFDAIFVATSEQGCSYHAGLAELHDWLFFVCARQTELSLRELNFIDSGALLAYSLRDDCRAVESSLPDGCVVPITDLSGYQFPNGLDALVTEDAILLADEEFLRGRGGISKVKIDFSAGIPVLADYQHHWLNADHGVYAANAVRVVDGNIYLTDVGFFKRVKLNVDGSPSRAKILFRSETFLDDFDVTCNGFLIADFVRGRLVYVPKE
ncbi:MAG TPA: hypothetical protein VM553_05355, partial [Dongiaceae bacterium]|nr:hypothetical protein [Dongiaceae bacterium]